MAARSAWCAAVSVACGAALVLALSVYPLERSWLAGILLAYAILLALRPRWWLFALPALLPAVDLAPRTGWFFLEEVDLLLLATTASCYWRMARRTSATQPPQQHYPPAFLLLMWCMAALCLQATWRGLQALPPIDANSFTSYLSPYNALRVAKGWFWAMLLLPALRHDAGPRLDGLTRYFIPGLLAGLAIVCYENIRERLLFPGLLNFSTDYRSSAPFSAMHTGGAALDGYLALVFPVLACWLLATRRPLRTVAALLLCGAAGYVGLATFSRGLLAAYLLTVVLLAPLLWRQFAPPAPAHVRWRWWCAALIAVPLLNAVFRAGGYRVFALSLVGAAMAWTAAGLQLSTGTGSRLLLQRAPLALVALLILALAIPFANGYYTGQRLASSRADFGLRLTHWQHVLRMMPDDPVTMLFGMGTGTFPATYYWHNPQGEQPGSFRYVDQDNNRYLQLAGASYPAGYGEMLRMLQRVELQPATPYVVAFDARNPGNDAFLYANICQRELLYPDNCLELPRQRLGAAPAWRHVQLTLYSGPLGTPTGPWRPPIQLELSVEGEHAAIDIDNVSLRDALTSHELIRNGSFTDANSYWFFSSDRHHLPWHIKNLGLNLYFEMGAAGLLCFLALIGSALAALWRRSLGGDHTAMPWLASMLGFLVVGLFDSLLDVPRITLLFLLLLAVSQLRPGAAR
jgi:hypothetical protein